MNRKRSSNKAPSRTQLLEEIVPRWRELSAAMVLFQTRAAKHFGLTMTDLKAIDILAQAGELSAGELATRCGLTRGAVTGLLDRLERARVVRRVPAADDARRLVIRVVGEPRHGRAGDRVIRSLQQALRAVAQSFTLQELEAIHRFLAESAATLRRQAEAIRNGR
jgi:DNA-binding MarR family transcriptional regulator